MRSSRGSWLVLTCLTCLVAAASIAAAQTHEGPENRALEGFPVRMDPDAFGLDVQVATISPLDFVPDDPPDVELWYSTGGYRYANITSSSEFLKAGVGAGTDFPLGAVIGVVCLQAYDSTATGSLAVGMWRFEQPVNAGGTGCVDFVAPWVETGDSWNDGYTTVCSSAGTQVQTYGDVDGDGSLGRISYAVGVRVEGTGSSLRFGAVSIQWVRQISPAPVTATFADVPVGSFGFQHIEALADSGITAGCGGGNFCPDGYLTRAQMAVFLAKALGLHFTQ
jgi:hypothetical protein